MTHQAELFKPLINKKSRFFRLLRSLFDLQFITIYIDIKKHLSPLTKEQDLIDIGCGTMPYSDILSEVKSYSGIEHRKHASLFNDTHNAQCKNLSTSILTVDSPPWPIETSKYDISLCTEVLEHVYDLKNFLLEIKRITRPQGLLFFTIPFATREHFIPNDYWRLTRYGIEKLFTESGYRNIKIYPRGNALTVIFYKISNFIFLSCLSKKILATVFGILFLPLGLFFHILSLLSLPFQIGNDCLGYTVFCQKPDQIQTDSQ